MKPDEKRDVFRSVTSREVGSPPNLGRVEQLARIGRVREGTHRRTKSVFGQRLEQLQREQDPRRRRRRSDPGVGRRRRARRLIVTVWSLVVGLVAFGTLVVAFGLWLRPMLNRKKAPEDKVAAEVRREVKAAKVRVPLERETLALVKSALAVRDPQEVDRWIRRGAASPEEVVAGLQAIEQREGKVTRLLWLSSVDRNGLSLEGVEVSLGEDKRQKRFAALTPDAEGVWKLDYAAYARVVEPAWDQILSGEAKSAVVRVTVAHDRYYNGPFADEATWAAYGMVSSDIPELLVGYCRRGSVVHRAMEMMWSGQEVQVLRATLEIRRVEGGGERQFEISSVVAEDWVQGDRPFDEVVGGGE